MPTSPPPAGPSRTKGWATIGLSLLALAAVLHFLTFWLGLGIAVMDEQTSNQRLMLATIGVMMVSGVMGGVILLTKVIVDRMTNEEDKFYSQNVKR